jgi:hypothetical protein
MRQLRNDTHLILDGEVRVYFIWRLRQIGLSARKGPRGFVELCTDEKRRDKAERIRHERI